MPFAEWIIMAVVGINIPNIPYWLRGDFGNNWWNRNNAPHERRIQLPKEWEPLKHLPPPDTHQLCGSFGCRNINPKHPHLPEFRIYDVQQ